MKKICVTLVALSLITPLLSACGEDGNDDPKTYQIHVETSEVYEIYNIQKTAHEGETVFFDVRSTSVFYDVNKVYANEDEVKLGSLGYSFVMPNEDVYLKATTSEVGEYDDLDDHLSWGDSVNGKIISLTEEEKNDGFDHYQRLPLVFDGISSGNWINSIETEIYSSHQEVIPDEAITFVPTKASTSNAIIGGYLNIYLNQVNIGETYIYVHLDPNNASLGTLMRKFEVISPEEELYETMPINFEIDNNTNYSLEEIFINLTDTIDDEINSYFLSEAQDGLLAFDYRIGHTYRLTVGARDENNNYVTLYLNEWVGTNTGGAVNSIEEDSSINGLYILKVETSGIDVPLVIND